MLTAREVTVRYPGANRPALSEVSAAGAAGRLLAVVGPNGCGKTTLLRAMLGLLSLEAGSVELDGRPIHAWPARDRARLVGAVAQREEFPFAWRVDEVVMFGRYPWLGSIQPPGAHDREVVRTAMARCDIGDLAARRIDTLSGGEWQRVRVARALAQEPRVLVLDEPTAALDLGHEMEIFELIRTLVDAGLVGIVVTHHLNVAARYADEMLLLAQGRTVAHGTPGTVLDPGRLSDTFGWPIRVIPGPDGAPQVVPVRRDRPA
jgi:ABC-type cobalamin/Fe3+-siderophores transport system ATPase subunit